jgi:methylglutaconyl-CoA hydratase
VDGTQYSTIIVGQAGKVVRITLDRPEVRNAFTATMVRELREAIHAAAAEPDVRAILLTGAGSSFCAGADLNWMREIVSATYEQNIAESLALAELLEELDTIPKPTLARVNGTAIGGGTGFLSACDISIASSEAKFGLSEVKLGLVPAVISPYIVRRIGESQARRYFLTGERFGAHRAAEIGLVHMVVDPADLDARTDEILAGLLSSGPEALAKAKELLRRIPHMGPMEAKAYGAEMIAALRVSPEGQEGMAAFLERRKPRWAE